ncbi:hypothetical protein ABTL45_19930, partial [Acinetobacter baumannii]
MTAPPLAIHYTFTGTAGDTVNGIRLCLSTTTDGTCATCASTLQINSGTPLEFNKRYTVPYTS